MDETIFQQIINKAPGVTEPDIDAWVLPSLMDHYKPYLRKLTWNIYKESFNDLAVRAFSEMAKIELRSALVSFFVKKQHWKSNRSLNQYCLKTLKITSIRNWAKDNFAKFTYICPACAQFGRKEILNDENGQLVCYYCLKQSDYNSDVGLRKLYQSFAYHSKKGYKCPECNKFLPKSLYTDNQLICPYLDCCFFTEDISELKMIPHPKKLNIKKNWRLDFDEKLQDNAIWVSNKANALHASGPDNSMEVIDSITEEFVLLKQIIVEQKRQLQLTNPQGTLVQKTLMYEAYEKVLEAYPIEMVGYLIHMKLSPGVALQAKIFQEFTKLIEDYLPFSIRKHGEIIDILSLTDDNLGLFLGKSEYLAEVDENRKIPNNTKEIYVGGRSFKNHGPCFIGRLIDVIDTESGISLMPYVVEYSFSSILMKNVEPGTKVLVKHFRIASHYEIGAMVLVQGIKWHITDKVIKRQKCIVRRENM